MSAGDEGREEDRRFMALALALGRRGLGRTWPNPAVGAVIVRRDGGQPRIVGRGWTQPGGRPHAEIEALRRAGEAARGADLYVTLEPCSHHGKSPPCADAIIAAGVARVVSALEDPNPGGCRRRSRTAARGRPCRRRSAWAPMKRGSIMPGTCGACATGARMSRSSSRFRPTARWARQGASRLRSPVPRRATACISCARRATPS